jgi:phosphohistidine phosphatase
MPKNLLLIRHAKSGWDDLLLPDFQRALNERGQKNAPEMAQRMIKKQLIPQQLVSSPALRALSTAKIFASTFRIDHSEIIQEGEIYEAHSQTLLEVVNNLDDSSEFTALFGHNPGLSDLANYFCDDFGFSLPTCGMILMKFQFDKWQMLSKGTGELIFFDYPKNISSIV